jgi:hypothetical protein
MSEKWAVVFSGPEAVAELHAQELNDAGIPTYVPDPHLHGLDAPSTSGYLFAWQVLVPRAEEARARALLATT